MSTLDTTIQIISESQTRTLLEEYQEKEQLFYSYCEFRKLENEIYSIKKWLEFVETLPFFQILKATEYQLLAIETSKGS